MAVNSLLAKITLGKFQASHPPNPIVLENSEAPGLNASSEIDFFQSLGP